MCYTIYVFWQYIWERCAVKAVPVGFGPSSQCHAGSPPYMDVENKTHSYPSGACCLGRPLCVVVPAL